MAMSGHIPFRFKKRGYLKRIEQDLPASKWLKGNGNWRKISCVTLLALFYNYFKACKLREIGHGSARWTYAQFANILSHIDVPIKLEWLNDAWNELSYKNYQQKYATGGLYYGNQKMNKKLYWDMLEKSAKCDII